MARSARQFSVNYNEDDGVPLVRIKLTARAAAAAAPPAAGALQRTGSGGSPHLTSLRPGPITPTAVGFTPEADPMGFRSSSPNAAFLAGGSSPFARLNSAGSLSSSYGSKDMEEDVLAAISGLTSAIHLVDSPGYIPSTNLTAAAAAAAGLSTRGAGSAAAAKRPASARKRSSFRRAASSRLAQADS